MRHAKATPAHAVDHDRELAASGIEDARTAGEWLAGIGLRPDAALVSSAARTAGTWRQVATGGGFTCPVRTSEGLYAAEPASALDLIRGTAEDVETLVVVGHNPTMGFLAQVLDDGDGDTEAADAMIGGFPTCALAIFGVTGNWADQEVGGARLSRFYVPRAGR